MITSLELDDELEGHVQRVARLRQRSVGSIIREALVQYVDREDSRSRFVAEADASWAAFQQTGRHLTGEEVQEWLATWGDGEKSDNAVPDCHGSS